MYRELKYQEAALNALTHFLQLAYQRKSDSDGLQTAFKAAVLAQANEGHSHAMQTSYRNDLFGDKKVPWVCLRLPTGAGKTYLAARSIGIVAKEWLEGVKPLTLWLVPSDIILDQTLNALQNPNHPYRKALTNDFGTDVEVIGIADLPRIGVTDWGKKTVVLVSTGQALKIDASKKGMRNVYANSEAFEAQFTNVSDADSLTYELERITAEEVKKSIAEADAAKADKSNRVWDSLTEADIGKVKWSAINMLRMQRPLVIVDEAHKAQGDLSKDVLQRVNASCVLELTATPKTDSNGQVVMNVLYHVSALALKAENMIKMPVYVTEHPNAWQEVVANAVLKRAELEQVAKVQMQNGGQYLRPIMLMQAEADAGHDPITPIKLKDQLVNTHHVPENQIAIATGTVKELENKDLMSQSSEIRFVITVQALVEGWDCPFAYVLCSVRNMRSNTAIVQLLGRVLRMPYAARQPNDALNCAYAYTMTEHMGTAAGELVSLVTDKDKGLGFNRMDASELCQTVQPTLLNPENEGALFVQPQSMPTLELNVSSAPNFDTLPESERPQIEVRTDHDTGKKKLYVTGEISHAAQAILTNAVPKNDRETLVQKINHQNYTIQRAKSPALRGEKFASISQLCIREQGDLILLEPDTLIERANWDLSQCPSDLPSFDIKNGQAFIMDMDEGNEKLRVAHKDTVQIQLAFTNAEATLHDLIYTLEEELQESQDGKVTPQQMAIYLKNVLNELMSTRKFELATLLVYTRTLKTALAKRIDEHRREQVNATGTQLLLSPDSDQHLFVSPEYQFEFKPNAYPVRSAYEGSYTFKKHYYPMIDSLKDQGEEFECAKVIDLHPQVKYWVRNLVKSEYGYSLTMHHGGRMYPDFVCQLTDNRVLLIEYKGNHLFGTPDTGNKKTIGELWARKSGNVFLLACHHQNANGRSISQQIDNVLNCGTV